MDATFYLTNRGESGWRDNTIFAVDPYEILIEEIKTIFDTKAGKVLGAEGMDGDLERYVFMRYIDVNEINNKVKEQITKYSYLSREFEITIESNFGGNDDRKICIVQIGVSHIDTPDITENITVVFS